MHDLTATTALGGTTAEVRDFEGLRISECPDWALASLASRLGREDEVAAAAQALLGAALPGVGACAGDGPVTAFWIGPEQWMLEAPHGSHEDLAARIKAAMGDAGSVTEQTDGWVRFDLEGAGCHQVLELLCNADTRRMDSPAATRTAIAHQSCFLIRRAERHFSVIGPRSSAQSLHHALIEAAHSAL
ncbi:MULTISPECIES: sarcosine oxidase subunit gamma [Marinovum]|uniref:sarcosine oxidase subunit gamma n=1 Tax=Marinovum TaxID=367771 RepID=UPI00237A981B|nr:sarcosine oxidase subunit gamma family protein [Marinovum sp. PR37]MDD9742891.1 sarcosine oxidase subunit gamma family protein [Marinovum sp. PR37]